MSAQIEPIGSGEDQLTQKQALATECTSLEQRLVLGYHRIEEAIKAGDDVTSWERFWIELLHQYESVCVELGKDKA